MDEGRGRTEEEEVKTFGRSDHPSGKESGLSGRGEGQERRKSAPSSPEAKGKGTFREPKVAPSG